MQKHDVVKVFGIATSDQSSHEFNGELVVVDTIEKSSVFFYFKKQYFKAHLKQTEKVSFLYPNFIYVRDPYLNEEDPDKVVVTPTDIANCYARRGSHWIKYIIDPDSLHLLGEEDEDLAKEKALAVADVIVSREKFAAILKESLPDLDDSKIDEILSKV